MFPFHFSSQKLFIEWVYMVIVRVKMFAACNRNNNHNNRNNNNTKGMNTIYIYIERSIERETTILYELKKDFSCYDGETSVHPYRYHFYSSIECECGEYVILYDMR